MVIYLIGTHQPERKTPIFQFLPRNSITISVILVQKGQFEPTKMSPFSFYDVEAFKGDGGKSFFQ